MRQLKFSTMLLSALFADVEPWQRGTLARPEMQLDPNPLQTGLYEQVYDSKEAASGGTDTAGAGCGCN